MKIFLHPTKIFQENWQQKGCQRLERDLLIHPQRCNFPLMGWEPRHVINFPASRSKDQPGPFVEFIPGIVETFLVVFEEKKNQPKCWQGNVLPPKQLSRIFRDFAGIFCVHLSVGSESADSWKPEDQGRMDLRPPACD